MASCGWGTRSGDIRIVDVGGPVDVRSIDGEIDIENARGGVRATSQSDDVTLRRVSGSIEVHSGSGDILLEDVQSESVRAETQDGDIVFSGTISDRGEYAFYVHDGDALIAVPSSMNARVSVSTFDGEFGVGSSPSSWSTSPVGGSSSSFWGTAAPDSGSRFSTERSVSYKDAEGRRLR